MLNSPGVAVFLYLSVGAVSLFTFLSVATWSGARQKEREAYYKGEMLKRIAEIGGADNPALTYLREQERFAAARRLAGFKIGGLVNIAIGVALMILLHGLVQVVPVYLCGTFPLFVGIALLIYVFALGAKGEI